MISIYREGERKELGFSIGWIRGPVFCYARLSIRKDLMVRYYLRFKRIEGKFYIDRNILRIENYTKEVMRNEVFLKGYVVITNEMYENAKDKMGWPANFDILSQ